MTWCAEANRDVDKIEKSETPKEKEVAKIKTVVRVGTKREKKTRTQNYYQRVLFSGTKVKCRLVQHLHKVLQAWHIDFIFHRLRINTSLTWICQIDNYFQWFIYIERKTVEMVWKCYSQQRQGWGSQQKGLQVHALCPYPWLPGNTGHTPRKGQQRHTC